MKGRIFKLALKHLKSVSTQTNVISIGAQHNVTKEYCEKTKNKNKTTALLTTSSTVLCLMFNCGL